MKSTRPKRMGETMAAWRPTAPAAGRTRGWSRDSDCPTARDGSQTLLADEFGDFMTEHAFVRCGESFESFLFSDGRVRDLAPYFADVINDRGESFGTRGRYWALLQDGSLKRAGKMRVGLRGFTPLAMNSAAQVVGYCTLRRNNAPRPCFWHGGLITFLARLPETSTGRALDINERGVIVGRRQTLAYGPRATYTAVVWANGVLRKLPGLGGQSSAALAINNRGDVVGWSETRNGHRHAALWKAATW